jgi:hypothetical protein
VRLTLGSLRKPLACFDKIAAEKFTHLSILNTLI